MGRTPPPLWKRPPGGFAVLQGCTGARRRICLAVWPTRSRVSIIGSDSAHEKDQAWEVFPPSRK
eukprot:15438923-Alexandrium_andersonii.AAC.1